MSRALQNILRIVNTAQKCSFLGTDDVCGRISEHNFVLNRGYGTYVVRLEEMNEKVPIS